MRLKLHIVVLSLILGMLVVSTPKPLVSASALMPPPAPMLISPANGALMDNGCKPKADGITWDFDWSDVPGVTAYHLKVFRNPNIPLINNMNVPASSYHYVSAPHDHIINSNLNLWRWTVRAKVHGAWGRWSEMRGFRVEKLNTDCPWQAARVRRLILTRFQPGEASFSLEIPTVSTVSDSRPELSVPPA